jgi:formylglycine-generating enzyme required for sulfatase activity
MVRVGCYCVDATEVSRRQYAEFVDAMTDGGAVLPGACRFKTAALPASLVPTDGLERSDLPVTSVDWCDAHAYCAWANKRLCGAVGGGPATLGDPRSLAGQWYRACSREGADTYPYGATYVPDRCNDGKETSTTGGELAAVGATTSCEGAYSGLLDMSGNASEWEDACSGDGDRYDTCAARGGNAPFAHSPHQLSCEGTVANRRDFRGAGLGFRCCGP